MNRLATTLENLKAENKKAFVPFITGGDPSLEDLPLIIETISQAGASAIEIGIPYSDPIADGPVIQESSQRALDKGVTLNHILKVLSNMELENLPPIILMGYVNTAYHRGFEDFCKSLSEAGVSGALLSDLPADEAGEFAEMAAKYNLGTVFLASPTSTDDRIKGSATLSTGFVYAVSRTGVTGEGSNLSSEAPVLVNKCRQWAKCSVLLGFGLSNFEQIQAAQNASDGAIVGSTLVRWLHDNWKGPESQVNLLEFLNGLA